MERWLTKIAVGGGASFFFAGAIIGLGFLVANFIRQPALNQASISVAEGELEENSAGKSIEELTKEARERSSGVKAVYMSAVAANDPGRAAAKLRQNIIRLLETTELNGVVIDVKESDGVFLPESLKDFVAELHQKNVWVIARVVAFNDTDKAKAGLGIALSRANGKLWLDQRGNAWLDPASTEAWDYIVGVGRKAIDYGFDELQFDYIRFPSDGDVKNAVYPVYQPKLQKKHEVIREFFQYLSSALKEYRPQIILSADIFGYVAIQESDTGVGQRMEDLGNAFDYISFMLYPSHYYSGFQAEADPERNLPALYYPYRSSKAESAAASKPYDVVYRSLLKASDFLAGKDLLKIASSAPADGLNATTTLGKEPPKLAPRSFAKLRPWLQDFDLRFDTSRGIYYDAEKVRTQIDAAEDAGADGWMLWNPGNIYTESALKKD